MGTGRRRASLALSVAIMVLVADRAGAQTPQGNLQNNLQLSSAVDLVAPISLEEGQSAQNKLDIRSAELVIFGPIDHLFDGVLNIAGHTEEGEFNFEIHEGYVGSSRLIPLSRFKLGKFFLGVGRLNQFHQHDWPFISAPEVQRRFFGDEAAADTGAEYSILLPLPFFLDLTIGVTNGYCYGHCHGEGARPVTPLYYLHPTTFIAFGSDASGSGLLLGASYLGRTDSQGVRTTLLGIDGTFKRREGKTVRWLVQSEVWHRTVDDPVPTAEDERAIGAYVYPQYGLDENWYFGVRFDAFSVLNKKFAVSGEDQPNFDYAIVPTLTYKTSEFSTLRAAYSHAVQTAQGEGDVRDRRFELQFVYILGAHPAHDF